MVSPNDSSLGDEILSKVNSIFGKKKIMKPIVERIQDLKKNIR